MADPRTRKRSARSFRPSFGLLVLLVLVVAGAGTAWSLGLVPSARTVRAADRTGKVPVPVAARAIPAYSALRRDDLVDAETMEVAVVWLDEQRAQDAGLLRDAGQLLGRVLAHDKDPAYAFTETDFLPKGTRPGPTAGIEPGMRGLRVPVERVRGVHGLRRGDRFDLVAAQPLEDDLARRAGAAGVHPALVASSAEKRAWDASARVLVQNGKVVEPVRARLEPGNARKPVEEVLIAVREGEVEALTRALALGAEILCLPRSGLPGAGESDVPEPRPERGARVIELLSGSKRTTALVPEGEPPAAMEGAQPPR